MGKYRMEEPWGYQEESDYKSNIQEEVNIAGLFDKVEYNKGDNKMYFYDKYEKKCGTIDVSEFEEESIVKKAYYDKETQEIIIEFVNGDVVRINVTDVLDENEFKDGLQVNDGIVSILIDSEGEGYEGNPYLSTSENGLKISGIDKHIDDDVEAERVRAVAEEARIDAKLDAEIARATAEEARIDAKLDAEIERAKAEELAANRRIDRLNDELDAEKTIREAADAAENLRATSEETRIETKIDNEVTRATEAETQIYETINNTIRGINESIASEAATRAENDNTLSQSIEAEITRAEGAESALLTSIETESSRAISAETDLQTAIGLKADKETTYTQEEVDTLIRTKETEIYNLTKIVGDMGGNVTYTLPNELGTSFNTLMNNNGTVKLTEDVVTGRFGPGVIAKNHVTLNLNGKKLTVTGLTESSNVGAIYGRGSQEITVTGGTSSTLNAGEGICIEAGAADVVINLKGNMTFETNRPDAELIYCYAGTINISGGVFKNNGSPYLLNCYDANYQNGTAKIIVTGGKFYDFNPADNSAEGEHTSFVSEGYHVETSTVTEEGVEHTIYTVKKDA